MNGTLTVGGLFDGCGLLAYGLHLAGLEHRWLCEKDEFRAGLLEQRFPGIPVYRDVRDVGADAEPVDIIAGGFPCKGVSVAGQRAGFDHPETALWREQLRIVRELRPRYVLVENVAALLTMRDGELFGEVVGGLAACGYDSEWDCFPAAAFGAPHGRDRVFLTAVADAEGERRQVRSGSTERLGGSPGGGSSADADAGGPRLEGAGIPGSAADGVGAATDTESVDGRDGLREGGPGGVGRRRSRDGDGEDGSAAESVGVRERPDRRVRRGNAGGGNPAGRTALPTGPEMARAADTEPGDPGAAADTARLPERGSAEESGADGERAREVSREAAADSSSGRRGGRSDVEGEGPPGRGGSTQDARTVEWGEYGAAIDRWEAIVGRSAPEPLVRRVDDGRPRGLDRSRLSALGDGVLVQAGWLCGRRIVEHAGAVNAA